MAETKTKVSAEAEVSTTELAAILGVTARRVQQMAQDGTIVPVRRGYFQLGDAVQRYIQAADQRGRTEAGNGEAAVRSAAQALKSPACEDGGRRAERQTAPLGRR